MNLQGDKMDLEKLLRSYEGREVPADMLAWFTLARETRMVQRDMNDLERDIRDCQQRMKALLTKKQHLVRIENHYLESMDRLLPQGGEGEWANLA